MEGYSRGKKLYDGDGDCSDNYDLMCTMECKSCMMAMEMVVIWYDVHNGVLVGKPHCATGGEHGEHGGNSLHAGFTFWKSNVGHSLFKPLRIPILSTISSK